jgi:hypothetical protein
MLETIKCILHNIRKAKMFGTPETYNVAVTESRCIFAGLTADLLKKAAADANEKGKDEGKGFLGRWGDQIAATLTYGDRYLNMSPDDVMRENPKNFSINLNDIKNISFNEKTRVQDKAMLKRIYGEVTFDTNQGKTTYQIDGMPVDDIAGMRGLLGNKVRG